MCGAVQGVYLIWIPVGASYIRPLDPLSVRPMIERSLHSRDDLVFLQWANYSLRTDRSPALSCPLFSSNISSKSSSWSAGIPLRPLHGRPLSRSPGLSTWTPWPPRPGVASSTPRPVTACLAYITTRMQVLGCTTIIITISREVLSLLSRKSRSLPLNWLQPDHGCNPR